MKIVELQEGDTLIVRMNQSITQEDGGRIAAQMKRYLGFRVIVLDSSISLEEAKQQAGIVVADASD